jgi:hypothetical protein
VYEKVFSKIKYPFIRKIAKSKNVDVFSSEKPTSLLPLKAKIRPFSAYL